MITSIRASINKLIRRVPRWVTTGEKLRVLENYYTKVEIDKTMGASLGLNDNYSIRCHHKNRISNVHIGRTRNHSIGLAYRELYKVVLFWSARS